MLNLWGFKWAHLQLPAGQGRVRNQQASTLQRNIFVSFEYQLYSQSETRQGYHHLQQPLTFPLDSRIVFSELCRKWDSMDRRMDETINRWICYWMHNAKEWKVLACFNTSQTYLHLHLNTSNPTGLKLFLKNHCYKVSSYGKWWSLLFCCYSDQWIPSVSLLFDLKTLPRALLQARSLCKRLQYLQMTNYP